jgi:hypothetical protein
MKFYGPVALLAWKTKGYIIPVLKDVIRIRRIWQNTYQFCKISAVQYPPTGDNPMSDQKPPEEPGEKKATFLKPALDDFEEFYNSITNMAKTMGIKEAPKEEIRVIWEDMQKKKGKTPPKE